VSVTGEGSVPAGRITREGNPVLMAASSSDPQRGVPMARPCAPRFGNEEFLAFFQRCRPRLIRTLLSLTDDTRVVDDVSMDALVIAERRWDTVSGFTKPEAWVLKVALRMLRRWQARHSRETELTSDHDEVVTDDPIARYVVHHAVHDAIRKLPPRRAEVVVLHHFNGYSTAEIAEILGVKQETVRSNLCLARADLKEMLGGGE
jgi:RNA polymerase sigma-70 factor (ECF subfamily)